MSRQRMLLPFIKELLLLLFTVGCLMGCFLFSGLVVIRIKLHFLTVTGTVILLLLLARYISRIVNWGIRAAIDMLFPKDMKLDGRFKEQHILHASMLTSTKTKDGIHETKCYYFIEVTTYTGSSTFLSSIYLPLKPGHEYSSPLPVAVL